MITNSDREKLAKNFFSMPIEDMYKRFKEAIELVNNVYSNLLIIPKDFINVMLVKHNLLSFTRTLKDIL